MFGYKPLSATGDVTGDDVAVNNPGDVENDADGVVTTMPCMVDVGEAVTYMVDVLRVIVALTLAEGFED